MKGELVDVLCKASETRRDETNLRYLTRVQLASLASWTSCVYFFSKYMVWCGDSHVQLVTPRVYLLYRLQLLFIYCAVGQAN